jgi:hypothetical protein
VPTRRAFTFAEFAMNITRSLLRLSPLALLVAAASSAEAQVRVGTAAFTDSTGTYLIGASAGNPGESFDPQTTLWTYRNNFFAIPESVAFSQGSSFAWAGQYLNGPRLQRFAVPGNGIPADRLPGGFQSISRVAGANAADLVAYFEGSYIGGPFNIKVLDSDDDAPRWTFEFPAVYNNSYASSYNVKLSRDGAVLAAAVNGYDQATQVISSAVYAFDTASGTQRPIMQTTGQITGIDLSDDGSLCLVTEGPLGRLFNTNTGQQVFQASISGAGGRHAISGDGSTLVLGGFNLAVYRRATPNAQYQLALSFTAPNSWFGWGVAVSRNGRTVGAMSHDYVQNYLVSATRIWDIPSNTLLGTYNTAGTGQFQGSISGAAMSDDGEVFAVSSWGVEDNAFPEVLVFNRQVQLIASANTPGSVFGLDVNADGQYVLAGAKAVHANTFGNGGDVVLLRTPSRCRADFNSNGTVDLFDYLDFVQAFANEESAADFNGNGTIDFFDYLDFAEEFAAGCA